MYGRLAVALLLVGVNAFAAEEKILKFEEYCELDAKNQLSREASQTVGFMVDKSGQKDCAAAAKVLTEAKTLDLSNWQLTDITAVASLPNLVELNLSDNGVAGSSALFDGSTGSPTVPMKLAPLAYLKNLRSLRLFRSTIDGLAPLSGLVELRALDLDGTGSRDLSALEKLTNLEKLSLRHNGISDITPLKEMVKLKELNLEENPFYFVVPLRGMKDLEVLKLAYTKVTDASYITDYTPNLKRLSVSEQEKTAFLAGLKKLEALLISKTKMTSDDIAQLASLTELKELQLLEDSLTDITGISKLRTLTRLNLAKNQIEDVKPISEVTSITNLKINDNQIKDLSPLKTLTKLQELIVANNPLTKKECPVPDPDKKICHF